MHFLLFRFSLALLFCLGTGYAVGEHADPQYFGTTLDDKTLETIEATLFMLSTNPNKRAVFNTTTRNRTVLCKTCHGEDGKAVKPMTPNLAAQNADYLVDQLRKFRSRQRYDFWMTSLSQGFSDEEIINIAIWYSLKPEVSSATGDRNLIPKGQKIFQEHCSKCHRKDGKGNKGYARLAGQQADYIVKVLKAFRDRSGHRTNPWMTAVALRLSEEDMQAVASYISHLK
ncbi:c-type cytochrome [Thiolapillus sp.]